MTRALKRFFISSSLMPNSNPVLLPREETHHLKNVLRMKEGDLCLVFDSEGHEFVTRIERYRNDSSAELKLIEAVPQTAGTFLLTVAQAIPQDRKMDDIVRQAAELGVFQVIPLLTERTIARVSTEKSGKVVERWQRIADQTLKQSRLAHAPQISAPVSFKELCRNLKSFKHVFILDTNSDAIPVKELSSEKISQALLLIGPEGGFSDAEVAEAEQLGARRVSLGTGILKTDTAFVAAAGFFKLIWS